MITTARQRRMCCRSAGVAVAMVLLTTAAPLQRLRAAPRRAPVTSASSSASARVLLDKYCVGCHNQRVKSGKLALDSVDLAAVHRDAEVWERVIRKLSTGAMPPPGRPRPDQESSDALSTWLASEIDRRALQTANPGRTDTFHRLNRAEYQNAVRDVLAVDVDATTLLPADDSAGSKHAFDNTAEVLSVSPTLVERYMVAARKVARLAVGMAPNGPVVESYKTPRMLSQDERLSEDLPFGSRGGIAVRHVFPVDGEYVIKVGLQKNYQDYARGMGSPQHLDVRVDGVRARRFTVGGGAAGKPAPASYAGNVFGDAEWEDYLLHIDRGLEVQLPIKAGPHMVGVSFERKRFEAEGVLQPAQTGFALAINEWYDGDALVESVEIRGPKKVDGPGDTPSRRKLLVCRPLREADEAPCARKILSTVARAAYRRPATEADLQTLLKFFRLGRATGPFDSGIEVALERMLVDPDFLFRIERDPPGVAPAASYPLSGLEQASRLSFFLWSSVPDEELLDAAGRGTLKEPAVLDRQVRRMVADPRAKTLVDNFAGQWLSLRNLRDFKPDPDVYPDFDDNLRLAFQRETDMFLASQLREDRSVLDLLNADYTFVNEHLARHYGIPGVVGERFRRVRVTDDQRRGLLGHGSILAVTSYPNRTSPVLRGKWLLESILGAPPPPPPPNVPALPERGAGGKPATVRERLEEHRKNPSCASCHSQMDPLGFALENFDAIGGWRVNDNGERPIDSSGTLPNGTSVRGPAGLRDVLLRHREQFVATVTENLLAYAIGRPVEYYDLPTVRRIVHDAAAGGYRWSALVHGVVTSTPFQMRRTKGI
jgi:mono/diheme cytochrome c family protein